MGLGEQICNVRVGTRLLLGHLQLHVCQGLLKRLQNGFNRRRGLVGVCHLVVLCVCHLVVVCVCHLVIFRILYGNVAPSLSFLPTLVSPVVLAKLLP